MYSLLDRYIYIYTRNFLPQPRFITNRKKRWKKIREAVIYLSINRQHEDVKSKPISRSEAIPNF